MTDILAQARAELEGNIEVKDGKLMAIGLEQKLELLVKIRTVQSLDAICWELSMIREQRQ